MTRRALLIDDERLARAELRRLLAAHPEVEIAGEAANVAEALAAVEALQPDLLFLDIEMPGGTGFDLLAQLDSAPLVIFTTAYDEFALRAFEVSALDYVVKPVVPARLAQALAKLPPPVVEPLQHLFVKDGDRCFFVRPEDLILLESEGNYTRLYFAAAGNRPPLVLKSLSALEQRLPGTSFFRANRKQLINLNRIRAVNLTPAGDLEVTLESGPAVELSRRQSQLFKTRLSL